jgi:hypothetical protein
VKNTGQTPAYNAIVSRDIFYQSMQEPVPRHIRLAVPSSTMTIPRGDTTRHVRRFPRPLTDLEVSALKASNHALFVVGLITYEDAFGKKRWTRFAYQHNGGSGAMGVTMEMTGCARGNYSDRDGEPMPDEAPVALLGHELPPIGGDRPDPGLPFDL